MTADQLLFATHHLSLTNETVMVDLSNILAMQRDYDGCNRNREMQQKW